MSGWEEGEGVVWVGGRRGGMSLGGRRERGVSGWEEGEGGCLGGRRERGSV